MRAQRKDGKAQLALPPESLAKFKQFWASKWGKDVREVVIASIPRTSISDLSGSAKLESAALTGAVTEGYIQAIDLLDFLSVMDPEKTGKRTNITEE